MKNNAVHKNKHMEYSKRLCVFAYLSFVHSLCERVCVIVYVYYGLAFFNRNFVHALRA